MHSAARAAGVCPVRADAQARSPVLPELSTPTLVVHGTKDKLVEIEGAQHGFAVHDDPKYLNLRSQEWQVFAIRIVADWIIVGSCECVRECSGVRSAAPRRQRARHIGEYAQGCVQSWFPWPPVIRPRSATHLNGRHSGSPLLPPLFFYPERTVATLEHHMTPN